MTLPTTLGELKKQGYKPKSIKQELRDNLIERIRNRQPVFEGIYGFDDTVIPDMERAILSKHNILLLGLRGQAKTKLARLMVQLLDEYIPIITGSELNDDPMDPLSAFGQKLVAELKDETPLTWIHRSERYVEKLATPDVSVADLIGDVDPIKAATLKLPYSDERVIHFGLIPRSHRCIFVINEIPDLQARIQVSLFNILQEGDIQIRGFKTRLPLDIEFVLTANPQDYTNRGAIITPLKDRIDSQILTHYPKTLEHGMEITRAESWTARETDGTLIMPEYIEQIVEMIAVQARKSEFVDQQSGVSARMTITTMEALVSNAERRAIVAGESVVVPRIVDLQHALSGITGKVELVFEGEQEGPMKVARALVGKAVREVFGMYFPNPLERPRRTQEKSAPPVDPYAPILKWFGGGNVIDPEDRMPFDAYYRELARVPTIADLTARHLSVDA